MRIKPPPREDTVAFNAWKIAELSKGAGRAPAILTSIPRRKTSCTVIGIAPRKECMKFTKLAPLGAAKSPRNVAASASASIPAIVLRTVPCRSTNVGNVLFTSSAICLALSSRSRGSIEGTGLPVL
ncbi:hypothetical protein D3C75_644860 [compost metagenome]